MCSLVCALLAAPAVAQTIPLDSGTHPRMFLTSATLPTIKAKLGNGGLWHSDFQTFVRTVDAMPPSGYGGTVIATVIAPALVYATYPVSGINYGHAQSYYGALTKSLLDEVRAVHTDGQPGGGTQMGLSGGWGTILAYDWVYAYLSPADRTTLANYMKTAADPDTNNADIFVSQTMLRRTIRTAVAMALKGDPDDNGFATTALARYAAWFEPDGTGSFRAESAFAGDDGSYSAQGMTYGLANHLPFHILMSEAWRAAHGYDKAAWYTGANQRFIRYLPQALLYHMRPWGAPDASYPGGRRYVMWQGEYAGAALEVRDISLAACHTAIIGAFKGVDDRQAGLAQWTVSNRTGSLGGSPYEQQNIWPLWKFVLGDATTPVAPDSVLAPNRVFAGLGNVVMRSDFSTPSAPLVVFQARRFNGNTFDNVKGPGHFTIDRKGPAVGRQASSGGHGAGSEQWAHNFLAFPSRDITTPAKYDDQGGLRGGGGAITNILKQWAARSAYDMRESLITMFADPAAGRDVDYIQTDITRSYSSSRLTGNGNPARIDKDVREFIWFRGAVPGTSSERFVVLDRAALRNPRTSDGNGGISAEWYFHFLGKDAPVLNGSTAPLARNGNTFGRVTSLDATELFSVNTTDSSNVKSYLTPLLPIVSQRRINLIGGPGPSGDIGAADSFAQQDAYGVMLDPQSGGATDGLKQYMGWGRVEIVSNFPTPVSSQLFLNVVEVGDSGFTKSSTAYLSGTGLIGARVGDRLAVFNGADGAVVTGDLTVDRAGTYRAHFANLTPGGEYDIIAGGTTQRLLASDVGTMYLSVSLPGAGTLSVRASGRVVPPPPAPADPYDTSSLKPPANLRIIR